MIHDIIAKLSTATRVWVVLDQQPGPEPSQAGLSRHASEGLLKKHKEATLFGIERWVVRTGRNQQNPETTI